MLALKFPFELKIGFDKDNSMPIKRQAICKKFRKTSLTGISKKNKKRLASQQ